MGLTRKDGVATVATVLAVAVFAACRQGWGVPLVGGSERWAAGAILVLGVVACSMGTRRSGTASAVLGVVGAAALVFAVLTLITGSLTWLALLTVAFVALWLGSTFVHARPHRTAAA